MTDAPRAGAVLRYPYLWARQAGRGETEGRKSRPCAVILALRNANGQTELRLCAVTTQPPHSGTHAVEVPEIERRRAGLEGGIPLWPTSPLQLLSTPKPLSLLKDQTKTMHVQSNDTCRKHATWQKMQHQVCFQGTTD